MAEKVIRKQKNGVKYNIIIHDEEPITQTIKKVNKNSVTVMSRRLKTYNVKLGDEVKGMTIGVGDLAVVATLKTGWKVIDVIKQEPEPVISEAEAERQLQELESLIGGY